MLVIVKESYDEMSTEAARIVADRLRRKPDLVLGLATGSTPLPIDHNVASWVPNHKCLLIPEALLPCKSPTGL